MFDEVNTNTVANRIIRSTITHLLECRDLDRILQKKCRTVVRSLQNIDEVRVTSALFKAVRVTSNKAFYKFLLNVCELIHNSWLVDEESVERKFKDFTGDRNAMAALFQSFLFNFIARECPQWSVSSEEIRWHASSETDPTLSYLPRMRTDISVRRPEEYKIIDAKFYTSTLTSYFDAEKVHSANLYQIVSYLMNANVRDGLLPQGMLIYPKVDRDLRETYEILGRAVNVCTVNLNAPWQSIDQELRAIML